MLSTDMVTGSIARGSSFADIIVNTVNSVANQQIQGFSQYVHDPVNLKQTVTQLAKQALPVNFADAVTQRRIATDGIDNVWKFPFNVQSNITCPIPWTFVEASLNSQSSYNQYEFSIMRTIDFLGRSFLKLRLPEMDTSQIADSYVKANPTEGMKHPEHSYLGAWHTDLIPRIIQSVEFYTQQNAHRLFEYSGYDIYIHNAIFGNANKEINDVMSGEDKFTLCYDPYRVDGSAMGMASYKGVDTYAQYSESSGSSSGGSALGTAYMANSSVLYGQQDSFIDYFKLDTTMDDEEFRNVYRHNVWYEAPVARNYHARHSIHSRRVYHQAKEITIPLDILPFGYSIGSSLPTAAINGNSGFTKVKIFQDWLDKAFYLTKFSDVPSLHPLVNHMHYAASDLTPEGVEASSMGATGWVNERSIGRYGDPAFVPAPTDDEDEEPQPFTTSGNILNMPEVTRENIIPTKVIPNPEASNGMNVIRTNRGHKATVASQIKRGYGTGLIQESTSTGLSQLARTTPLTDSDSSSTSFLHKLSSVDSTYYNQQKSAINVKLIQVGYQVLPCIKDYLTKLPNIYITTEWKDEEIDVTASVNKIDIKNDLYMEGIVLWAIPKDANGIESMRVYPSHLIDHENPILAGIELVNEQAQGQTRYSWDQLNLLNFSTMGINPIQENIGLISFSPCIKPNDMPFAFYDSNIASALTMKILKGDGVDYLINLKQGKIMIICIGVNGVANVNLSLFRLIF